jgi:hypothetical protein
VLYTICISTTRAQSYVGIDLYLIRSPSGDPVFLSTNPKSAAGGQVVGYRENFSANGSVLQGDGLLWIPPSGDVVDLTLIAGIPVYATDGNHQVGGAGHALLWSVTAASVIDLHPAGFYSSRAYDVAGAQQVGVGQIRQGTSLIEHALLWNGTAASAVDLHPTNLTGFDGSIAIGTDGVRQVGWGYGVGTGGNVDHALLWSGTATSAIDLHPTNLLGYSESQALGVGGNQQVGVALRFGQHAMLWSGTANSAVDLNPAGSVVGSIAYGTNGIHQVGVSDFGATLWSGTAASAINLNALLPFISQTSDAHSIDAQGNIFGVAFDGNDLHAVEWSPLPEPAAWASFALGTAIFLAMCSIAKSQYSIASTS